MDDNKAKTEYGNENRRPRDRRSQTKKPLGLVIFADILVAALILMYFYLSNYVWERDIKTEALVLPTPSLYEIQNNDQTINDDEALGTQPEYEPTETQTVEPSPTPDMSIWRNKFADKFTDGEVIKTDNSYQSANVNVSIERFEKEGSVYFVTDIYIADIQYFKTSFGQNTLGKDEYIHENLSNNNGVVGINGDNCWDNPCLLIRNGIYYDLHQRSTFDTLVMYNDGSMETIYGPDVDFEAIKATAPYQTWGFGPMLLDEDGQPMSKFNSTVAGNKNPRTAIGYYEPGHYCFVVVDGRRPDDYSEGFTMTELSQFMYDLGCKKAFNLDGGASSQLAFIDEYVNIPSSNRRVNDMIYITDSVE